MGGVRKISRTEGKSIVRIPINDMKRHFAATRDVVAPAVERVLDSGWYIFGNEGDTFEKEFAAYCGAEICVGVGNGTDALELALRAIGVTQGSRVATAANAGFYTSTTLLAIGASPVFVDVDRTTHLMDPKSLREVLSQGVEAVVVTHLYGLLSRYGRNLRALSSVWSSCDRGLRPSAWCGTGRKKSWQLRKGSCVQLLPYQKPWRAR